MDTFFVRGRRWITKRRRADLHGLWVLKKCINSIKGMKQFFVRNERVGSLTLPLFESCISY